MLQDGRFFRIDKPCRYIQTGAASCVAHHWGNQDIFMIGLFHMLN